MTKMMEHSSARASKLRASCGLQSAVTREPGTVEDSDKAERRLNRLAPYSTFWLLKINHNIIYSKRLYFTLRETFKKLMFENSAVVSNGLEPSYLLRSRNKSNIKYSIQRLVDRSVSQLN